MKNIKTLLIISTFGILTSCVNETYTIKEQENCVNPNLTKSKEITDIYSIAINPPLVNGVSQTPVYQPTLPDTNDIIEGYVVSSDEGGNFYQNMYIQGINGSKGFNISVDEKFIYENYPPGKKVYLKLKDLAFANPSSFAQGLVFGAPATDKYAVDRLQDYKLPKHLIPSCDRISEDLIVNKITIAQAKANDNYLNTLVEFDNTQFATKNVSYDTNRADNSDSSILLTDGASTIDLRTSRYASFAGNIVPSGIGKIRGILTKYSGTYQLVIRTERDVKITGGRTYPATINENFESFATTTAGATFLNYINQYTIGTRLWDVKTNAGNKYIQMTSFGAGPNKTYFAVPLDYTAANTLSFKTKDGYFVSNVLKVYYTTDYIVGTNLAQSNLVDITSNFTIASGTTSGYATNFTNSGTYAFPTTLTGNGFIVFEYSGTTTNTTTIQIDDITVN